LFAEVCVLLVEHLSTMHVNAAAAGDQRYKDAAYQLWFLLDATSEGKWEGLVNTWWNVTDGSWLPGMLLTAKCHDTC
jgi:predicted dithiol-disulfide oxidoreductase (DUF899 family)